MSDFYDDISRFKITPKQAAYIISLVQSNLYDDEQLKEIITQLLTRKASIKSIAGNSDIKKIQRIIHQPWLYKVHYFLLSFDDVLVEDNVKAINFFGDTVSASYKWLYSITRTKAPATVTSTSPVSNIVGLHLAPISIAGSTLSPTTQYNATILIDEFSAQSFSTSGRRYHFTADIALVNDILISNWNGVKLDTTNHNRGYYWFHTPIKSVQSFTFTFAQSSPMDRFIPVPIDTAPVYFIPGRETLLYLPYSAPYYNVDYYYFKNFSTTTPTLDQSIITAFNSSVGYDASAKYPTVFSRLRVVPTLDTSKLTNLSQYLPYTDQVWDYITVEKVKDGALLDQRFTIMYDNPVRIRTPLPHGITSGTTVFITNFIPQTAYAYYGDAAFDAAMNSLAGHTVTVIDNRTFSIPLDGTVISYRAVMYYLYQSIFPDYAQHLYLTTATLDKITINPVMTLEVITMKE